MLSGLEKIKKVILDSEIKNWYFFETLQGKKSGVISIILEIKHLLTHLLISIKNEEILEIIQKMWVEKRIYYCNP